MILIGVWPLLTNTMGIKTTDFILLVVNSGNGMQMLSPEGEKTWLIATLEKRSIEVKFTLNCLFVESKNQRSTEAHNIMATSVLEFISKVSGQSDLYTTPVLRDRLGWIQTRTTVFDEFIWVFRDKRHKDCLSVAETCYFKGCYQVLWGYHHQEPENASRG